MKTNQPLGLYVHFPFCKRKCLYCDFPSVAGQEAMYLPYIEALEKEIENRSAFGEGYEVKTIFFGGGTPTALPGEYLVRILKKIKEVFLIAENKEITVEANPGTLSEETIRALKSAGFNRLSMGLQAWQNRLLSALGRIHSVEAFRENFQTARDGGFQNINVDLMFALPGQSMADWQETLEQVIAMSPEHISAYSLILEEGTPFYSAYERGELSPVSDEEDRAMYDLAVNLLERAGYRQYEISNFAKVGFESKHNVVYWKTLPYLGVGLGAHSFLQEKRFYNTYDLNLYTGAQGKLEQIVAEITSVSQKDAMEEFMFLGLRMIEGVSFCNFFQRFGKDMKKIFQDAIHLSVTEGLLLETEKGICLTKKGIDLSNLVFTRFLLEEEA